MTHTNRGFVTEADFRKLGQRRRHLRKAIAYPLPFATFAVWSVSLWALGASPLDPYIPALSTAYFESAGLILAIALTAMCAGFFWANNYTTLDRLTPEQAQAKLTRHRNLTVVAYSLLALTTVAVVAARLALGPLSP